MPSAENHVAPVIGPSQVSTSTFPNSNAGFEGRSSVRASLYKIATNAALNLAQRRSRRELPASYGPCAPSGERAGLRRPMPYGWNSILKAPLHRSPDFRCAHGGTFGPTKAPGPGRIMASRRNSPERKEPKMRRKSFDAIVSVGGLLLTVVLVAAGALLLWAYSFANSTVTNQLSAQKITFPAAAAFAQAKPGTEITPGMIPYLEKYAGQQLTTGAQAEAYANHFIAVHLQEIGGGKTYSELSGAAMALPKGSAAYTAAEAQVQTVFKGTTLRSMLLNAYGWWQMGQIALIASIVSFVLAGVTLLLSGFGLWHYRRVPAEEEIPELRRRPPGGPEAGPQPLVTALANKAPAHRSPGLVTPAGAPARLRHDMRGHLPALAVCRTSP